MTTPKKNLIPVGERCQECGKGGGLRRDYYAKDYQGSCGDSFCYASCDMSACKPQRAVLCDVCLVKLQKPPKPAPKPVAITKPKTRGLYVEEGRLPDLEYHFYLVGHGYQVDVLADGKEIGGGCRDFDGDHKVEVIVEKLHKAISKAIDDWRKKL